MKPVADALGVARSNLAIHAAPSWLRQRRGRRPLPDEALLLEIKNHHRGAANLQLLLGPRVAPLVEPT
ncbi:MAG: hypothetical protein JO009_06305 [Candidatus Eremiobacteraeota bacterium]|nr:hypothetical protein [Candidatus Eremiobacteraeota bacterium]